MGPLRALLGSSWGLMCRIVEKLEGFYYFWELSWGILVENVEKLNTFDHFKAPQEPQDKPVLAWNGKRVNLRQLLSM